MKLSYSIPNKIWWIKNFLDKKTYKTIHHKVFTNRNNMNLNYATGAWPEFLYENLTIAKRVQIINYPPFDKLKALIKHNKYFSLPNFKSMTTTVHYMEKGAGINWHDDSNFKYGATYYLNNRWNKNWGGEFMFEDKYIPVVGNSLVIVKTPFSHKVNPVLSSSMPRLSVQIFMK